MTYIILIYIAGAILYNQWLIHMDLEGKAESNNDWDELKDQYSPEELAKLKHKWHTRICFAISFFWFILIVFDIFFYFKNWNNPPSDEQ
jgi:hypothetical protein